MAQFIVATHGTMAEGVKGTIELILGVPNNITFIGAYLGEESLKDQVNQVLSTIPKEEQVILFSDLLGGSVNTELMQFLNKRENIKLIAGFNLAVLLEFLSSSKKDYTDEEMDDLIQSSKLMFTKVEFPKEYGGEDDFF